jgi:hypothetical protein
MITGDSDADGSSNLVDCAPTDATAWAAPGPSSGLLLDGESPTMLTWVAPVAPGGSATRYDVLRSPTASSFASPQCIAADVTVESAADAEEPTSVFFYVVRAKNACGAHMGFHSDLTKRQGGACP